MAMPMEEVKVDSRYIDSTSVLQELIRETDAIVKYQVEISNCLLQSNKMPKGKRKVKDRLMFTSVTCAVYLDILEKLMVFDEELTEESLSSIITDCIRYVLVRSKVFKKRKAKGIEGFCVTAFSYIVNERLGLDIESIVTNAIKQIR